MAKKTFGFEGIVQKAKEQKAHLDDQIKTSIVIDPELQALIPPLSTEEFTQLEENIRRDGCREPLILWYADEQYLLVDGHNRYRICRENRLDFRIDVKEFAHRTEVQNWMITHQLGRRNLTPEQVAYFRGKRYENEKEQGKRSDLTSGQNVQKSTANRIAQEMNVNEKTIRRDNLFARGVDVIAGIQPELKGRILAGNSDLSKKQVETLAAWEGKKPAEIEPILRELLNEKGRKEKKAASAPVTTVDTEAQIKQLKSVISQQLTRVERKVEPQLFIAIREALAHLEQLCLHQQ